MILILNWLLAAVAIAITAYLLPGVTVDSLVAALIAAIVLGFINAVLRPIMILLTLPITIVTLGLFTLVINALLVQLAAAIVPGFSIRGFWWALLFALVLFFVNVGLSAFKPRQR
jgi:putative membrane protein